MNHEKKYFNERQYEFEKIFTEEATKEKIYYEFKQDILDSCINGQNYCFMTYGQTSSGKTYNMFGEKGEEGIV